MAMKIGTQMPSFDGATEWLSGTQAHAESEAVGHPTLVHFWSVSCEICKYNLEILGRWREEKREQGLRLISVHMPRIEADLNVEPVRELISQFGMSEPVAVDNMHKLRDAFQNVEGYVPAYYLFDAEGKLRGSGVGRRGLELVKPALDRLTDSSNHVYPANAVKSSDIR